MIRDDAEIAMASRAINMMPHENLLPREIEIQILLSDFFIIGRARRHHQLRFED